MTELFWISYVALAVTVIILCIAMVFIYRLIGRPALLGMTPLSWPLTGLRSGDPLPSLNATALLGPTLHGIPEDGFLVLTSPASGFAATLAVAITAIMPSWPGQATTPRGVQICQTRCKDAWSFCQRPSSIVSGRLKCR